ncbi:uncharacterized protein LOC115885717 [Sitophilus oryzae]|uniref:Uncharacterized protein LOC115885717 n=1 Tax=Sitophilus oryzae TaxID=7048 RepID=A0A6J2YCC6_SITOR|nr:uncharacterized protein LOC115885717 [Sitophilus oryzae]
MNGFFEHKNIHKYTWHQETRQLTSIIDYIMVKQNTEWKIEDVRAHRGVECGSDHYLVKSKMRIKYKRNSNINDSTPDLREKIKTIRYKTYLLKESSVKLLYQNRLKAILDDHTYVVNALTAAASEALGEENTRKKSDYDGWNRELEEQKNVNQKTYHKWICTKSPEDRTEYKKELATFKKLLNRELLRKE